MDRGRLIGAEAVLDDRGLDDLRFGHEAGGFGGHVSSQASWSSEGATGNGDVERE